MAGAKTLEAQIGDGTAKVQGDASILKQLASTMVEFDPRFEIMPAQRAGRPWRRRMRRSGFESVDLEIASRPNPSCTRRQSTGKKLTFVSVCRIGWCSPKQTRSERLASRFCAYSAAVTPSIRPTHNQSPTSGILVSFQGFFGRFPRLAFFAKPAPSSRF